MKKTLIGCIILLFSITSFAQSWLSKTPSRIENDLLCFKITFTDSSSAFIQKKNVSYIVNFGASVYAQMGFMWDGSTSKIINLSYNTLTAPSVGSGAELSDTLNSWIDSSGSFACSDSQSVHLSTRNDTVFFSITRGNTVGFPLPLNTVSRSGDSLIFVSYGATIPRIAIYAPLTVPYGNNGITRNVDTFQLGGVLVKNTTIGGTSGGALLRGLTIGVNQFALSGNIGTGRAIQLSGTGTSTADGVQLIGTTASGASIIITGTSTSGNDIQMTATNGKVVITGIPAYNDDAAAGGAGLTIGRIYQTTGSGAAPLNVAGILMIKQ